MGYDGALAAHGYRAVAGHYGGDDRWPPHGLALQKAALTGRAAYAVAH